MDGLWFCLHRTKNEEVIVHLISTWPDAILNLNVADIPVENYLKPSTNDGPSVADSIIRGLFYRKRKYCQLQMLILPKDASTGRHQNLIVKYADDTYLLVPASLHSSISLELDHFAKWDIENNLRLNVNKS